MHPSLERLLQKSGLSQEELAKRLDESSQTVSNWKRRGVSKSGAIKASAEFDVSVNWILKGDESGDNIEASRVKGWDTQTPLDDDEVEIPFYKDFLVSCGSGTASEIIGESTRKLRLSKATFQRYGVY